MAKYYFENKSFVIEDFQNAKRFCSFFPAVAGVDGKPLWAFYANVGQCMGGFGVGSKETPMTPFDSATLAYQNIPTKSFRTFLRVDNEEFAPFFDKKALKRVLRINRTNFSIEEISSSYSLKITYSTISHKDYPALIRKGRLKLKYEFKKLTIDKAKYFKADVKEDTVLADLRSSLISNPRNSDALFRLYQVYYAKNDYRKAQYYLRQVVAINPNDSSFKKLNEALTKLMQ